MSTKATQDFTLAAGQPTFKHNTAPRPDLVLNNRVSLEAGNKHAGAVADQGLRDINHARGALQNGAGSSPGLAGRAASVGLSLAGGALATQIAGPAAAVVGLLAGLGTMVTINKAVSSEPSPSGSTTKNEIKDRELNATRGSAAVPGTFEYAAKQAVTQAFGMKGDIAAFDKADLLFTDALSEISGLKVELDRYEEELLLLKDNTAQVRGSLVFRDDKGLAIGSDTLDAAADTDMKPGDNMQGKVIFNV